MTDEEYVRAHFPDAHELQGRYGTCIVWLHQEVIVGDWAAAAEFVRDRLEQIRQLERQIEWCKAGLSDWYDPIYWHWDENEREEESVVRTRASNARDDVTGRLIVARLESALAELRRGMKA